VAVERRGDVVELSVEDDGPGVSERERQQLFEPFVRGEAAKRAGAEGQGLGLALIAHVAMIHGGDAAFDGARARGARLTVRLPAWR
jgi:two-component system sensor histidine kinase SenX3